MAVYPIPMRNPILPHRTRCCTAFAILTALGPGGLAAAAQAPAPPAAPVAPGNPATPATPVEPTPSGAVRVLSLDQVVQETLRANPTLEDAAAAVRRAEAVVAEARALQRPRLDANATLALQGPIPRFSFTRPSPNPGGTPITEEIALGRTFTRGFSVSGTYDPDLSGRLRAGRSVAERGVNVARGSYFVTQNELVFAVQNVYLAALRANELIQVSREAVEAAQEQLRVAQAQLNAGLAPEFDVLRASVQVENLRQNQVAASATFRRTTATLTELMSLDPTARVELAPVALPPEPDAVAVAAARQALEPGAAGGPTSASLEAALSEAFTRRPEVYRALWAQRLAEARVDVQRRGNRPNLAITASGNYNPDATGFAAIDKSWSLFANITVPIWDAGLTRARTRQAREEVASAAAQAQGARNSVAQEVTSALITLEEATARRTAAAANTAQAREALRIARVRYSAGLAQAVEVTDAQVALTQARTNEVNAGFDYLSALAELNRGIGRYAGDTVATVTTGTPIPAPQPGPEQGQARDLRRPEQPGVGQPAQPGQPGAGQPGAGQPGTGQPARP